MIKFDKITKIYYSQSQPVCAINNISLEIKEGEFVSIIGKSGAGKTTLIKLLIGEDRPTEGKVFFKDTEVGLMGDKEIQSLRREIGVVHQDYKLLPSMNVRENVEY